jgi:hypothetical protein
MKILMKRLILSLLVPAAALMANADVPDETRRPNFLLILADDTSPEQFGCYGNPDSNTPNIDALASTGVQFNTAWATPMCSPTRALLVTGRYASRTGVWHNDLRIPMADHGRWDWAQAHLTFAQVLRANGYRTALSGKIMALGGSVYSDDVGFDEQYFHGRTLNDLPKGATFEGLFEGKYNFPDAKPVPSRYWHPCIIGNGKLVETGPDDFGPDLYTDFLIDFMARHKEQPFLAYFPMNLIHDIAGGGLPTMPSGDGSGSNTGGSPEAMVAYADMLVGRLVSALDELGLRENTIVIFAGDNGASHGSKMHATENGPRVPFVVNGPGIIKTRGPTDALMDFSDIFPTFVEFSQSKLPDGYRVDGKSLVPFLTGQTDTHRDWIASYIATARMVRTRQWLLEAADPVYGKAEGRIYNCGSSHLRRDYKQVDQSDPAVAEVRKTFDALLEKIPFPSLEDPAVAQEVRNYDNMPYKHFLNTGELIPKLYP